MMWLHRFSLSAFLASAFFATLPHEAQARPSHVTAPSVSRPHVPNATVHHYSPPVQHPGTVRYGTTHPNNAAHYNHPYEHHGFEHHRGYPYFYGYAPFGLGNLSSLYPYAYGNYPYAYGNYGLPGYSAYDAFYPPTTVDSYPPPAALVPEAAMLPARIEVLLPRPDAQVWIDGNKTSSLGTDRIYSSPPLAVGSYSYRVTAFWLDNGQEVRAERTIQIVPGGSYVVDFTKANESSDAPGE